MRILLKVVREIGPAVPVIITILLVFGLAFGQERKSLPRVFLLNSLEGLEVPHGKAAGLVWESLIHGECNEAEHQRRRQALLDYCARDTLGMVKIVEALGRNVA